MQLPQVVELKGIRVLTSKQLAEEYGTTTDRIKQNFGENREYFIDGKHYISLAGDDLRVFKNQVRKENNQVGKKRPGCKQNISSVPLDRKRSFTPCQVPQYRQGMAGI